MALFYSFYGWVIFHCVPISSNTLHTRHNSCLLISNTHLPRCRLWLSHSIYTRKRSFHIFYLPLCPRRTCPILWVLYLSGNMKYWNYPITYSHSHRIHRLRSTLRTNIILRRNCHRKPTLSNPIYRHYPRRMNLR
uniref:Uncharacterized protein n=1 Tax=Balaenoptera musculus TaxID=9771 RepID=A0A8C0CVI6_BALMU